MIDLTPLDVRKKKGDFRRILRGFDPEEVDAFLEIVEARLETLVIENLSLQEKTQRLASQLEALEGREKAVQEALVTAQKLREDVQNQSAREAESVRNQALRETDSLREQVKRETESLRGEAHREASILRDEAIREAASVRDEARRESDLLRREVIGEVEARILEAEGLIRERQKALEELERSRKKFLKGIRSLLERELDSVEVEEGRTPLEDTALELTFKSWPRSEEEEARGEPDQEEGASSLLGGAPHIEAYEPVIELDRQGEGDGGATQGWGAMPGDEPPEGEFSDIVPLGVFEAGSPDPPSAEGDGTGRTTGTDEVEDPEDPDRPDYRSVDAEFGSTLGQLLASESGGDGEGGSEPLWLSSLLEQEDGPEPEGPDAAGSGDPWEEPDPAASVQPWDEEDPDEHEPRID